MATNEERASTSKDAIGLAVVAILIVAVVAVAIWYCVTHPEVINDLVKLLILLIVVIVAIAIIVAVAAFVFAVPIYALRGERFQKNVDYDLDDNQAVEDKKDKEGGAH